MFRTQIYLTDDERAGLEVVAETTGKCQSALIREAVDQLLARHSGQVREQALAAAAGMWKDRSDLPDFESVRRSMDRA